MEDLFTRNRKIIPGFFTLLNLFCGFIAIIKFSEANYISGCWFISFAAIFDSLDGVLARFTQSRSEFGTELDSLADIVSFGIAPSFLLYTIYYSTMGILGILISFFPLICGSIRLARFNVNFSSEKKTKFCGLPIPVSAVTTSSFVMFNYNFWGELHLTRFLGPQIVITCLLMISTLEYHGFLKISFKDGKAHTISVIIMLTSFLLIVLFPYTTLYPLCLVYIAIGIMNFFINSAKSKSLTT
ncbi:CDP-diacylglycerol--serine O-phosphatidyltransferase [candidate division KSB1 bacterium]|nr:CDP-diacylglycerol--serine O-phosphatidyltransferase [candidate division KSB1 bacterium]